VIYRNYQRSVRILKTTTKWSALQRGTWRQWRFAWVLRRGWGCGGRSSGEDEPFLAATAFGGARGAWRWRRRQGARAAWRPKKTSPMRRITWRPVALNSFSCKCNRTKPWKCSPSSWIRFRVLWLMFFGFWFLMFSVGCRVSLWLVLKELDEFWCYVSIFLVENLMDIVLGFDWFFRV